MPLKASAPAARFQQAMLTKNTIKHIRSLSQKKFRDASRSFIAEGPKVVGDLLPLFPCRQLFATPGCLQQFESDGVLSRADIGETVGVSQQELERLSQLKSPRGALAVFATPGEEEKAETLAHLPAEALCLALDGVQDPGNLGTIVRIADWFGIEHIFCSPDTADAYAPKVVQATMGAIGRVRLHYVALPEFVASLSEGTPVYGTFLDGENLYDKTLSAKGLIVMGNEGNGISPEVAQLVSERLLIPNYPSGRNTSESLNVAVATAIICGEFRRRA